jgi:hypothetical protein
MRFAAIFSAAAATAFAGAAVAAPTVDVSIGPNLQKKVSNYGAREFTELSQDLQRSVMRTAGPALDGAKVNLVIAEASPNHPTFKQLGDRVGLSPRSISIGGAKVQGTVTYPDGRVLPVEYSYYDTDIIQSAHFGLTTWATAQRAFDLTARKVARDAAGVTR